MKDKSKKKKSWVHMTREERHIERERRAELKRKQRAAKPDMRRIMREVLLGLDEMTERCYKSYRKRENASQLPLWKNVFDKPRTYGVYLDDIMAERERRQKNGIPLTHKMSFNELRNTYTRTQTKKLAVELLQRARKMGASLMETLVEMDTQLEDLKTAFIGSLYNPNGTRRVYDDDPTLSERRSDARRALEDELNRRFERVEKYVA